MAIAENMLSTFALSAMTDYELNKLSYDTWVEQMTKEAMEKDTEQKPAINREESECILTLSTRT